MVLTAFFTHKIRRAAILLVVLVAGIMLLFRIVPAGFVPEEDQAYIMVGVIMPDSASLQRTDVVMAQIEDIIAEYDAVQNATRGRRLQYLVRYAAAQRGHGLHPAQGLG